MAQERTIECQDCGAPKKTRRSNTKYCDLCRTLKDAHYRRSASAVCTCCGERFAPLHAHEILCPDCDILDSPRYINGTCSLCQTKDTVLLHEDVRVCLRCSRSTERRPVFIGALAKKRKARLEARAA